jgi:hypothetical protein
MVRARAALALTLALVSSPLRAETPRGEQRQLDRRAVVLDAARADGIDAELEATLGELLGRLRIDVVHSATNRRIVARVRIESSERGAVLTVESGRTDVAPVRREIERSESTGLFRETLAHVIFGAIEPLAELEESAERAPVQPPPVEPNAERDDPGKSHPFGRSPGAPTREVSPRDPTWVSIGGRAGPRLLAPDRVGIGFGGAGTLVLGEALHPSLRIEAGYVLPSRLSRSGVDAQFAMVPLRLGVGIEAFSWKGGTIEPAVHGGIDLVTLSPTSAPPFATLEPPTRRVQAVFGASVNVRFRVASTADIVIAAGADVDATPRRWIIASNSGGESFFETGRVRPYVTLGFDWTVLDASPRSKPEGTP